MDLKKNTHFLSFLLSVALIVNGGCSIKIGPDLAAPPPLSTQEPIFRVGEITENLTGTWAEPVSGPKPSGFRSAMIDALKDPQIASRFSSSAYNLTMNIELVSDHEDDLPRLNNLGALSMATLGIIPLNFFSEWNVDCSVKVMAPDGTQAADYVFQERGTYKIWAFPLTMLTLSGAGIRGDHDARIIYEKVTKSLAAKIADAIDKDYGKLAAKIGKKKVPGEEPAEPSDASPKPLIM